MQATPLLAKYSKLTAFVLSLAMIGLSVAILMAQGYRTTTADKGVPLKIRAAKSPFSNEVSLESLRAATVDKPNVEHTSGVLNDPLFLEIKFDGCQEAICLIELRGLRVSKSKFWVQGNTPQHVNVVDDSQVRTSPKGLFILVKHESSVLYGVITPTNGRQLTAFSWAPTDFYEAEDDFNRSGGFLFGGLLAVSLFCGAIAWINRDASFLLLAGWVVAILRFAAIMAGWDTEWMGFNFAPAATLLLLRLTLAVGPVISLVLHEVLLGSKLKPLELRASRVLIASSMVVLLYAFSPDDADFKSIVRVWLLVELIFILYTAIRVSYSTRARSSYWYAASWMVIAAGAICDAAFAAGFISHRPFINSQIAAIGSAFSMAVILADRMRVDRIARLKAETRARTALQKFKENFNSVPVGLATLSMDGLVQHANPAFMTMFDLPSDLASVSVNRLFAPKIFASVKVELERSAEAKIRVTPKDSANGTSAYSISASVRGKVIEASIQDITKEYEAEIRMKRLAHYDALTNYLNRRGLDKTMTELLPSVSNGTALTVAFFDLDKFKLINDLYGYHSGDEVIKEMGRRLGKIFRAPNVISRVAGDEFIVLLVGSDGVVAKNLCRFAVSEINDRSYHVGEKTFKCHVSVGLASISETIGPSEVFAFADRACREAKLSQGDERIVLFDPNQESYRNQMGEVRIESQMGQNLPVDRFFIEAQPIVSLQSPNSNFNYEVLVRMRGSDGETIAPAHFLKAVERNGLMSQLDRFVLRSTLEWLHKNPAHIERLTYASVNLSGASLNDHRFLQDALAIMNDYRDLAPKICFEITESVALGDITNTRHFTERVKAMGCFLALDDFGAGYTSFQYMKEFPADVVKIDGAYVKNMRRRSMDYAIVRAVTDLSHEIGMSVVAEWAETPDLIGSLAKMGVDYGQGWALGKPMAMDRLLEGTCAADFVPDPAIRSLLENPPKPVFRKPGVYAERSDQELTSIIIPGVQ